MSNTPEGKEVLVQPVVCLDTYPLMIRASAVVTAAGVTALWTPAAGKRVRIRGFSIIVDPATTSVAGSLATVLDGTTVLDDLLFLGIAAPGVPLRWQAPLPGEGLLSAAPDNVISVNLSAALTAGGIYVNVWGNEE